MRKKQKKTVIENITITDYAAEGKSLVKHEGKATFVSGAVPGDVVDILLTKNKKDWAEGRVVRMIHPAPDRVTPFCKHFGVCGGCKWQMLPYEKQLQFKQQEALQNINRIGKVSIPQLLPIAGARQTKEYRNKLEFTFSNKRFLTAEEINHDAEVPQQNALGFHAPRIFDKIIDIEECHLLHPINNTIRNTLSKIQ